MCKATDTGMMVPMNNTPKNYNDCKTDAERVAWAQAIHDASIERVMNRDTDTDYMTYRDFPDFRAMKLAQDTCPDCDCHVDFCQCDEDQWS